ncbi:WXG100 family type VII secretion target [Nocardia amamiensis]|uniref:WXG100 family type VII secretion target n=1 Tax=Nocardia amamiensis TaxID=404578 RepID=UPI0012F52B0A|nr:WXG100 family type VII secretion target [Nocardia amamiensis]
MGLNFSVEVADLRGWAEQVGRAGTDMFAAHNYAKRNIVDGDFGKILELITEEYTKLLPSVHDVTLADSEGQDKARLSLIYAAEEYKRTDRNFASEIAKLDDTPLTVVDDGVADGFGDLASGADKLVAPAIDSRALAEISLGIFYNRIADLVVAVGGPDPREHITKWLAGDIGKAGTQISAWRHLAECTEAVRANLEQGQKSISKTWSGKASTSAAGQFEKWNTALRNQKTAMQKMAEHLSDALDEAIKLAQVVVDIILTVINFVTAALTNAAIPVVGQIKLIKSVKDGIIMINRARGVIMTFWQLLVMIKSFIVASTAVFTRESLPTPAVS